MDLKKALPHYLEILANKRKPKFLLKKHFLERKIKKGEKLLKKCNLCERKCSVNRKKGEVGWCQVGSQLKISSCFQHFGEESFFVPSFTIFFWSCNFACLYCQNYSISQRLEKGITFTEEKLAQILEKAFPCKNLNFVGGEPTPYLPFILKTLTLIKNPLPLIWNSNFYFSLESFNLLKGIIDVYLSDFKYGNNRCGEKLSKVKNYFGVVARNHLLAFQDSEMVVRHLVLPNHFHCCSKPILQFIKKNFQDKVIVNLMDQYSPVYQAPSLPEINRRVTKEEFKKTISYAQRLGLNLLV